MEEDNKMADYFSKYRGRGGPAIEPGIIQMMGSIGDEYAKGIESFGESIASAIDEKKEKERQKNALDFILKLDEVEGTPDIPAMLEAEDELLQKQNAAKTDVEVKEKALLSAQAQTGEPGDRSKANEIRDRIDKYQDEIANIQQNLFRKDKAIDLQKKRLADPKLKSREAQLGGSEEHDPNASPFSIWDMSRLPQAGMTSFGINKTIQDMEKEREKVAKKLPKLQEDFILAKKFWQMESINPGSSKGMDSPMGSDEHQAALERLDIFKNLRDQSESQTKFRREALGPLAAQVDPEPIPTFIEALPRMLADKPEVLSRLLNYERPVQKSVLVENARNELNIAESKLQEVLSISPPRKEDYQRPKTTVEKIQSLYDEKKRYPKDFSSTLLSHLQRTRGPQYKVVNIKGIEYLLTNQGAVRLDADGSKVSPREKHEADQRATYRREEKENRENLDKEIKRIRKEISEINQKEFDVMSGQEGLNAEDIRRRKELLEELESVKEEFKSAQGTLIRDMGGDLSNPYTDEDVLEIVI